MSRYTNIDVNGVYRGALFIQVDELPQKDINQYAEVVDVEVLRCAFGIEEYVQEFEYQQLHAQVLRRAACPQRY
jgi:hypothetical protein